jgi:uncharacterized damage-inducible protein DinB
MIDEVLNSYRLTLDYLRRLVADVPDQDFCRQPNGVVNHPAWVIGHLTISCQAIGSELGEEGWLPEQWQELFGTGSTPTSDRSAYPSKTALLAALTDSAARVTVRVITLGDAGMSEPLPDERYRSVLPTVGHAVAHILISHTAVHVGQVSVWRRAAGYQPLTESFI